MENKNDLIKLFKNVAEAHKFPVGLIEKDYYLTSILHKISEKKINNLVFKGGTCLNKCYLGFYRLSEDLDFVYNKDVKDFSKRQIKKILDELRREFFEILRELGFKPNKKLGEGWKMITSETPPRIAGLEIMINYISLIDDSLQTIKIEISFRKKLKRPTKRKIIGHKFIDVLGEPILRKDVKIEVIDLVENFAEKFRALVIRKRLAVRDIYDIYFILKSKILSINNELIKLILAKINETKHFTRDDLIKFIKNLDDRISELNEKEIEAVVKTGEKINIKKMVQLIIKKF